ncbi:xanthine dehydrogenase family protein molybdopterin-binding subunit [Clostridium magnum]|uniref:4-hydroxybenzoyl-CoA reductase subunit alpha n=1 Tax=Clostridium magnum DSM 2767 TaxID=1121326 RepID=A0A162R0Q3_9CLOT|nr:xanthine dehydrogenase family protein molybdopterin-binding subunit [Clostridium magnum]KZL89247.1 4-hydroxybenzoyl-CoA reductase subunit alpha [Clostridium magnum DSM 2767]
MTNYVGKSVKRIDAYEKVTGKAVYATDVATQAKNAVYMHALTSPYAHAKIKKLDLSKAEKAPGVVGIITGDEPGANWELFPKDAVLAQNNEVIWAGQIIALVAAETLEQAKDAIELIDIEYEVLPHVLTYWDAIKADTPSVIDPMFGKRNTASDRPMDEVKNRKSPNVVGSFKLDTGNVDEAMKTADVIIERDFYTGKKTASQLETPLAVCEYDPCGKLTIRSNGMGIHGVVKMGLSKMIGVPENKLRVLAPVSGGSFGARLACIMEVLVAMMARKVKRTVVYRLTREQQFTTAPSNWPVITKVKLGAKKDGTIVALDFYVGEEIGAAINNTYFTGRMAASGANPVYNWGEARIDAEAVTTNTVPAAEYRGLGVPESEFALENAISELADKLGMSQVEIRQKNFIKRDERDCVGEVVTSTGISKCLDAVANSIKVDEPSVQDGTVWKRGKGIAAGGKQNTPLGRAEVKINFNSDGTVTLLLSSDENGMGATTALKQMAAELLKMDIDNIEVLARDTDATPYDNYGASSRTTYTTGNAVKAAALDLVKNLREAVGREIGVHPMNIEIEGTKAIIKGYQKKEIEIASLFRPVNFFEQGNYGMMKGTPVVGYGVYCPAPVLQWGEDGRCDRQWNWYQFAATAVEVAVNEETGQVKVLKYACAADTGNPINPKLVEGQIEGGVMMAIGFAVTEDHYYDNNGKIWNANLGDYRIPTILDVPKADDTYSHICPDSLPDGPWGAKGMAESITIAPGPAIAEAIYQAVGVRVDSYPMTAEKVLKLIKEKKAKEAGK